MSQIDNHNEEDKLKQEAPKLFGMKKEEPYEAPANYFEKFTVELADKIHAKENRLPWYAFILKRSIYIPATFILLFISTIIIYNNSGKTDAVAVAIPLAEKSLDEVSFEVLDSYVNDHLLAQVNTDEVMEMIGTENISLGIDTKKEVTNEDEIPTIDHVEKEEMEEYIMENIDEMEVY